ncbi:MAG: T9SS type A sorting domain-containing protein [Bacteroidales bacterium]|nr:T9SS type A sorting domain-containing protein [Bacteroidales bacterium]
MKNIFRNLLILSFCFFLTEGIFAEKLKTESGNKGTNQYKNTAASCAPASGFRYLEVNNVRARINTGGDMWWDFSTAQYFIPANGAATSMFSGSLWIGGLDINQQLKLAALRYRQVGNDYWPGPLTNDGTASVDEETCAQYDKHFFITRKEVDDYLAWWNSDNPSEEYPDYSIPESILDWPAHGDVSKNQAYYLAPFFDFDGDGNYDPYSGDYPYYDIDNHLCPTNRDPNKPPERTMEEIYEGTIHGSILSDQVIKGDETLWWVFNDKGNFHSETQGASIGIEVRAQAFGFSTNDEINNMTFYSYEVINRSTFELTETYFSPWVDTDLGYAWDDFVGCDVDRGLGYCYNGKAIDGSGEPESYGEQPPAIGVDFFQGPYLDADGYDNPSFKGNNERGPSFFGECSIINYDETVISMEYGDPSITKDFLVLDDAINGVNFGNGIVDDERFGMRRFVYHTNCNSGPTCDPHIAAEYYNFLRGIWKDNTTMEYGGNAHYSSGSVGPKCDFMFPGDSDPCNWGTQGAPPNGGFNQNGLYWTEETVGNNPDDRRFMQSAGPFTLTPGAVNYITVGIPWARATSGGPWASVELLRVVDDKCQSLFDNCFKVIDGPNAPDLTFQELDQKLIVYISNNKTSNNYNEEYQEVDPFINFPPDLPSNQRDSIYIFEGYQIFQLKNSTVSVESIHDPNLVRLVAQFDIKNGISKLVNYNFDQAIGGNVPVVEVDGGDNGINHSFILTEDAFATGDKILVNHKQYYFLALTYAYNEYLPYTQEPGIFNGLYGQKKPYLAGRKNIKTYTAIPHIAINGTIMNSEYGDGPQITRIEGQGNGGVSIELSEETINEILSKKPVNSISDGEKVTFGHPDYPIAYNPVYKNGKGPVNIKVVDPLNVTNANFKLTFTDVEQALNDSFNIVSSNWELINQETGKIYTSNSSITVKNEQLLLDIGLSIDVYQVAVPGDSAAVNNGLIEFGISFADSSHRWLTGISDNNVPGSPMNWIRSGSYSSDQSTNFNDWNMPSSAWDPQEYYEKIVNSTWAPYSLTAYNSQIETGPAYASLSKSLNKLSRLSSVDIVFTSDKSKWSRSLILEMCPDPNHAQPKADGSLTERFEARAGQSVDKEGNSAPLGSGSSDNPDDPNYINETGMGWFPGYAINIETGERLNIMFGEDSWLSGQNGRDMLFNPTTLVDSNLFNFVSGEPLFGGKHYVYVMGHTKFQFEIVGNVYKFESPAWDDCRWVQQYLDSININQPFINYVYGNIMYVGMPMLEKSEEWLANDATISIRIAKPYQRYMSLPVDSATIEHENDFFPVYGFKTENIATEYNNPEKAENDLDIINVVPNPYYAHSTYENNALDTRVKITNLPEVCTVTIYNVNGTMIRQFTKDDVITSLEWDLKNFAGVPIAGGIYLMHIKSDAGERIIKWFGALRPTDLNIF